ncbi:phage-related portal protein [Leifsonia xyli subsp. cynodontis DSM 46306]|uniref:Uncharacterized protein n=1 Tax=Leifsonia xyli subsp. cynodontis DSM 46306 TaxID=1389489 RepID=U3P4W7_LEIXC|nr:hypothetical protein [Leifsonia xyli]AGW40489.1 phage-related portal protein [Leifsonia xyli subsp. cynodontis DSM 46306]
MAPADSLGVPSRSTLADAAEALLRSRRRAAGKAETDAGPFALQALGAAGRLRGVLAVGSEGLD